MAIIRCKMCGGELDVEPGNLVAVCQYCGSKQTVPKTQNDRRVNLFNRANHLRRNNEYERALELYEAVLNEDGTDAEAYWSIVLCRYGIEYVKDPGTNKRIPTMNRTQRTSIYADEDYRAAIANASDAQKAVYAEEAANIDRIQREILAISDKEEPYDVFICYKETDENGDRTADSVIANDLYDNLEKEGIRTFFSRITLEDKLGTSYEPYIFSSLSSAKVMVVIGTKPEYFNAVWVQNEWSRFLGAMKKDRSKYLIPAYKNMDPYDLPEEFSNLQAQDLSKLGYMQDLIRGIKKLIGENGNTFKNKAQHDNLKDSEKLKTAIGKRYTEYLQTYPQVKRERKLENARNQMVDKLNKMGPMRIFVCIPAILCALCALIFIAKQNYFVTLLFILLSIVLYVLQYYAHRFGTVSAIMECEEELRKIKNIPNFITFAPEFSGQSESVQSYLTERLQMKNEQSLESWKKEKNKILSQREKEKKAQQELARSQYQTQKEELQRKKESYQNSYQIQIDTLNQEKDTLMTTLSSLHLFQGSKKKEIQGRLSKIDEKMKSRELQLRAAISTIDKQFQKIDKQYQTCMANMDNTVAKQLPIPDSPDAAVEHETDQIVSSMLVKNRKAQLKHMIKDGSKYWNMMKSNEQQYKRKVH